MTGGNHKKKSGKHKATDARGADGPTSKKVTRDLAFVKLNCWLLEDLYQSPNWVGHKLKQNPSHNALQHVASNLSSVN
jgi:hypothetical protein